MSSDVRDAPTAIDAMRQSLRGAACTSPESLAALAKDVAVLVKLLRNPGEKPEEPKFRSIKLANAAITRVLNSIPGGRDVLMASGFVGAAGAEHLSLCDTSAATTAGLLQAADAVELVQHTMQELQWIYAARASVPKLAQRWAADGAATALVNACVSSLHASVAESAPWLQRLLVILSTPEMRECRAALAPISAGAVAALRRVALELIHTGMHPVELLVLANKCLALLRPPGDAASLPSRLEFCAACLEAALPPDEDAPRELRLRLVRERLLSSATEALGAFSEVGVRCGSRGLDPSTVPLLLLPSAPSQSDASTSFHELPRASAPSQSDDSCNPMTHAAPHCALTCR